MPEIVTENRKKFQELLRRLFQFESADLDFGIYRILNHKRDVLDKFIEKDLPAAVAKELESGAVAEQAGAAKELQELAGQLKELLGEDALDGKGELAEKHRPLLEQKGKLADIAKKYVALRSTAHGAKPRPAVEAAIFNHLYTFFSRYYDAGDFMSKRRYSRKEKYAVPYNGEEVCLHWANKDQYYVKTGEYFTDYTFVSRGLTVHFKLQAADVEKDNVKGDKRFFVPVVKGAAFDEKAKQVVIPFEYRPLTAQEEIRYGKKNQQDAIIAEALEAVPKHFAKEDKAVAALSAERRKDGDGNPVTCLEHHLRQYTRRNTSDFFVHKDLKGFLERELDFYLKNEVLNIDDLEAAGEGRAEAWFQVMRVMKAIGLKVIAFLAQVENFQKKLFEKRKFITETHYCITMSTVPAEFHGDIAACDAQWEEWKELFHIDEEEKNIFSAAAKTKKDRRVVFLKAHPTLVLDTRHFSREFTDRLLAAIPDLDEKTDGLLVKGENFQALNLLMERYRGQVKCTYLDPPYNTGNDDFLYKDGYQHSSWLAMMQDRGILGRALMATDGLLTCSIADHEVDRLRLALADIFGRDNLLANFVWNNEGNIDNQSKVKCNHEYLLAFCKDEGSYPHAQVIAPDIEGESKLYNDTIENSITKNGPANPPSEVLLPKGFPASFDEGEIPARDSEWPHLRDKVVVKGGKLTREARAFSGWSSLFLLDEFTANKCQPIRDSKGLETWFKITHTGAIYCYKTRAKQSHVLSVIRNVGTVKRMAGQLADMGFTFSYPKPIGLIEYVCKFANDTAAWVGDYFAGSGTTGHAVMNLNRSDGGRRRFILVEVDSYFDTILLPRLKKAIFSPEWKDGKPSRAAAKNEVTRSPRIIRYLRIESYEDALNNIAFNGKGGQKLLTGFDDYLLNYMLEWETKESDTLLNVEKLATPFAYKLLIAEDGQTRDKPVDLPETFNYLLGLRVQSRKAVSDKDRAYLVYRGTVDSRTVAVIWRETKGWKAADFERDKKFVAEQKLAAGADDVFVNSDSTIPGAKSLDPVFKARMFAPIAAGNGGN